MYAASFVFIQLMHWTLATKQPAMTAPAMAAKLSNADMNDLAAYFSAQPAPAPQHKTAPANVDKGRQLSVQNNCVACHAATSPTIGNTVEPALPTA